MSVLSCCMITVCVTSWYEYRLRTLIDRPPVGGREFMPLSEQVLLGFRLHPGPVSILWCVQ